MVQWLACNGGSVTQPDSEGRTPTDTAVASGHDGIAAFLAAVSSWPAFKIMVACRMADDAKLALRSGTLGPCAEPGSLAELVAVSESHCNALWAGSPDVCPATRRLVRDAAGHWMPSRHFFFHPGVRDSIRVVMLCAHRGRARDQHAAPTELWERICSFCLRSDWEAPVPQDAAEAARWHRRAADRV